jgi:hypothetical protein
MCTTQQTQVGPRVIFHRQNEEWPFCQSVTQA